MQLGCQCADARVNESLHASLAGRISRRRTICETGELYVIH
jgi:hypothetical protein